MTLRQFTEVEITDCVLCNRLPGVNYRWLMDEEPSGTPQLDTVGACTQKRFLPALRHVLESLRRHNDTSLPGHLVIMSGQISLQLDQLQSYIDHIGVKNMRPHISTPPDAPKFASDMQRPLGKLHMVGCSFFSWLCLACLIGSLCAFHRPRYGLCRCY